MSNAGNRLGEALTRMSQSSINNITAARICYGTVKSVSPLSIQLDGSNDAMPASFFRLSPFCEEFTYTIEAWETGSAGAHTHSYEDDNGITTSNKTTQSAGEHTHTAPAHTITVWRGLQAGDRVLMTGYPSEQGVTYIVEWRLDGL